MISVFVERQNVNFYGGWRLAIWANFGRLGYQTEYPLEGREFFRFDPKRWASYHAHIGD